MKINKLNVQVMMSSCGDDRLTWEAGLRERERHRKREGARSLITLFQGSEVLPCVSLYMLELRSYKHSHVRKECSLLLSFGSGISYFHSAVVIVTSHRFSTLFVLHSKNYHQNA